MKQKLSFGNRKRLSYAKCKNGRPNLQVALYECGNDALKTTEAYVRKTIAFQMTSTTSQRSGPI
jgi:hypothetical protein